MIAILHVNIIENLAGHVTVAALSPLLSLFISFLLLVNSFSAYKTLSTSFVHRVGWYVSMVNCFSGLSGSASFLLSCEFQLHRIFCILSQMAQYRFRKPIRFPVLVSQNPRYLDRQLLIRSQFVHRQKKKLYYRD